MSILLLKKNTNFNIFKMAAAMTSLPKNTETAISRLIKKIETCKWCQNVGIEDINPVLFTELKYLKQLQRYDHHREICVHRKVHL